MGGKDGMEGSPNGLLPAPLSVLKVSQHPARCLWLVVRLFLLSPSCFSRCHQRRGRITKQAAATLFRYLFRIHPMIPEQVVAIGEELYFRVLWGNASFTRMFSLTLTFPPSWPQPSGSSFTTTFVSVFVSELGECSAGWAKWVFSSTLKAGWVFSSTLKAECSAQPWKAVSAPRPSLFLTRRLTLNNFNTFITLNNDPVRMLPTKIISTLQLAENVLEAYLKLFALLKQAEWSNNSPGFKMKLIQELLSSQMTGE